MLQLRRFTTYLALIIFSLIFLSLYRSSVTSIAQKYAYKLPKFSGPDPGAGVLDPNRFRWDQVPVRFPVSSLTPIPTAEPEPLPQVQAEFDEESKARRAVRVERQAAVKAAFERSWKAYKERAWMHDELRPVTGGYKDPFGGWGASLVDNLDNLWIMGLKDEFEMAVSSALAIDLGKVSLEYVNVFETTIRYLGGFLAAYDLSGDKRLLAKAREFGDMLLVAFDTPNRMPITRWNPRKAFEGPQVADEVVLVAEIGSLTMEFTRLSQLTGDPKWYDAVERIMTLFDQQQDMTHLPGMWPVTVNAKKADFTIDTFFTLSAMSDSLYEYFPKMHALLGGGVDPRYKKMYFGSMTVANEHNLFRPMLPGNPDILISGNIRAKPAHNPELDPQGQHLVCFAGGMFALGGRLFNEPSHVDIGRKLTDGCIWTYKNMPLGIMPEIFHMVPCSDRSACTWDEEKWRKAFATSGEAQNLVASGRQPPGFTSLDDRRYILRPEAIESVFLLYRITGDRKYQETAWEMFNAIMNATTTEFANAALGDVSYSREMLEEAGASTKMDSMESFWMAETLKYFFLVFSEVDLISLDEWVFNTEAHPLKRTKASSG
ncbi:glycoside hydrolase family 47 protein [Polychaeton citri CBS 116435]|uniref:alpha-1,2-Mannosidase n=1 Tax=Polychaeton citri CBS 116435 TaxID=1314669 RepID=A0A9P4Q2Z5_9PEZI|nr:glycoside hydrolase family 47 protein [Polychaeton citri CBS 116435]